MNLPQKILLATGNPGKAREERFALRGLPVEVVSLEAWPGLPAPEEHGRTFLENAVLKALYYHRVTGLAAVGEDSGLEVEALGGAPGIQSARWMGHDTSYAVKNAHLLDQLSDVPDEKRAARFVCAVALAQDGKLIFELVEICEGRINRVARGRGGFGYDPIFLFPPLGKTLAELSTAEKAEVSHRGKAMRRLRQFLDRL